MLTRAKPLKRLEVIENLREWISQQTPGDRLPPVTELTKHFNVSAATIVAALSELQEEGRVIRRHGAGNFVALPAGTAVSPRTGTGIVALLAFPEEASALLLAIMKAVEKELRRLGKAPLLILSNSTEERFQLTLERAERGEIDGFLQIGSVLSDCIPTSLPGVVIGEVPPGSTIAQVVIDNVDGGRQIGEHLKSLGHTQVVCVFPTYAQNIVSPRYQGLCDVLGSANVLSIPYTAPSHNRTLDQWRQLLSPVVEGSATAIVAFNDNLALLLIGALTQLNLDVPGKVSVVGFDDTATQTQPFGQGITTVRLPSATLGTLAAQNLVEQIEQPDTPLKVQRLPVELVVRGSTAAAPLLPR